MLEAAEADEMPETAEGDITPPSLTPLSANKRVMRAAFIIALGNIISRILGLIREVVKANLFGASGLLSAYTIAALVPMTIYQLIVGGEMVTSSLVPVFSDYVVAKQRSALWHVFSTFLSLASVVLFVIVILVELFAPQVAWLIGARNFSDPALTEITIDLMRLSTPAVIFLSGSSIITAVLYALERFSLPAFTVATFNGSIVVIALIWPDQIETLVWGLLFGSFLQVALQIPGLKGVRFRFQLDWQHPAVRRIIRLYAPIVGGLIVNQAVIWISYNLATRTGDASVTYMAYATTLYQFPLGLVVMGLSTATLPMLSQQANGRLEDFRSTLTQGIRLVIALILPAAAGLFALALPIVTLVFEHGRFLPTDTIITSQVLRVYVIGLPFAAVDQMLVFASYARKDTLSPALVGVVSMGFYLLIALLLIRPLGLLSLMAADAGKHVLHTALMLLLLSRYTGGLAGGVRIGRILAKSCVAALGTGVAAYVVFAFLTTHISSALFSTKLLLVGLPAAVGLVVYLGFVALLDISEIKSLRKLLMRDKPSVIDPNLQ